MDAIRIALTKGRLEKSVVELFDKMGWDTSPLKEKGRKLVIPLEGGAYEVVLAKAPDVLTYVQHGVCDVGVVGKDTILEHGGSYYELLDLQMGRCRFAVAGRPGLDLSRGYRERKIATKYPAVAKLYFDQKGLPVELIKIEGSVELAPLLGLADAIVDLVETGSTLKENGLVVLEEICEVSARAVVNLSAMKLKKERIEQLMRRLSVALERESIG